MENKTELGGTCESPQAAEKKDIFDRIMSLGFLKIFQPFYKKNKEILLYLFFGALTTVISYVTYFVGLRVFDLPQLKTPLGILDLTITVSNTISWICAVTFSYVTARIWVFSHAAKGTRAILSEAATFYGGRVFTLIVETVMINVGVHSFSVDERIMKIIATVVVLVLNYIISKIFVFKERES